MKYGYARVSSDDQRLALQLDALKKAGCEKIFEDQGVSGSLAARPALDDLIECLRAEDTLVIWSLDRLGRNLAFLLELIKSLDQRDIAFMSLQENIETQTCEGRLQFQIQGAFAEFERARISARTKAGLAAAKKRGVKLGRPRKISRMQLEDVCNRLATGQFTVQDEATRIRVARSTLYRRLQQMLPPI